MCVLVHVCKCVIECVHVHVDGHVCVNVVPAEDLIFSWELRRVAIGAVLCDVTVLLYPHAARWVDVRRRATAVGGQRGPA